MSDSKTTNTNDARESAAPDFEQQDVPTLPPAALTVVQLDADAYFAGVTLAYPSPLEPGAWLMPAGTVAVPRPRAMARFECARFQPSGESDCWHYLPDYRGAKLYSTTDGAEIQATRGKSLQELGATLTSPESGGEVPAGIANLTDLQGELLAALAEQRRMVEGGGITVDGVAVSTTIEDQNRITTVVANAQLADVETVDFKAASGWVTLTIEQIRGLAAAIARHVQACFTAERAHAEAIAVLDSLEVAQAYDIRANWPGRTVPEALPLPLPQQ